MKNSLFSPFIIFGLGLLIIFSFSLFSCKPDEPQNWTRYEYLNEARDYIYFKKGTWWVYKNLQDGRLDTIEVTKSMIDTAHLTGGGNTLEYEYLEWETKSRMNDYRLTFYRGVPLPDPTFINSNSMLFRQYYISKYKPGNYLADVKVFIYPFDTTKIFNGATHFTKFIERLDTLTINGILFNDIQVFEVTDDGTFIYDEIDNTGGTTRYYWAPQLGIIQMQHVTKNIQWLLIDSHIIQ